MNEWFNTSPYALIDGAIASQPALSRETQLLKNKVLDKDISLLEKLEAYDEIINIEVGDTSLSRARNLERETDVKQIYLKFEGGNPTGTQKDRIAFAQCLDALRREFDTVTAATCGNYGVSLALASNLAGLRCIICIPEEYQTKRLQEIQDLSAELLRTQGSYEDAVDYSKKIAEEKQYYDANPGGSNTHLQLVAYSEIANEIYDILRDAPRVLAAPVSNGTLLAGVYRGFVTLYKRGKTSRIPRIVAGSSFRKNPIIVSYKSGFNSYQDIDKTLIRETPVNEPLINWHSFDGDEALNAIRQTDGWAEDISDMKLIRTSRHLMEKEGLNVLPASTAGLIAFLQKASAEKFENDRYVAILTGRK
jgi:threonine synthase